MTNDLSFTTYSNYRFFSPVSPREHLHFVQPGYTAWPHILFLVTFVHTQKLHV